MPSKQQQVPSKQEHWCANSRYFTQATTRVKMFHKIPIVVDQRETTDLLVAILIERRASKRLFMSDVLKKKGTKGGKYRNPTCRVFFLATSTNFSHVFLR